MTLTLLPAITFVSSPFSICYHPPLGPLQPTKQKKCQLRWLAPQYPPSFAGSSIRLYTDGHRRAPPTAVGDQPHRRRKGNDERLAQTATTERRLRMGCYAPEGGWTAKQRASTARDENNCCIASHR
ncbi:unnamed protein product [Ectocarpus fasciculatus]